MVSVKKKQRVEGGKVDTLVEEENEQKLEEEWHLEEQESDIEKTGTLPKKRKRSKLQIPCHEMVQFEHRDFHGILKMYMEKREENVSNAKFIFHTTTEDDAPKIDGSIMFLTTCEVCGESGKGRAVSKKKSKALACLDIIQKLGLVPEEHVVDTMAIPLPTKPKRVKTMLENGNYLSGNFKDALRDHLQRSDPDDDLILESSDQIIVTHCRTKSGKYGRGEAPTRKKSVHLACLDIMLNMGLLTKEQHLEKHPDSIMTGHDASKSNGE